MSLDGGLPQTFFREDEFVYWGNSLGLTMEVCATSVHSLIAGMVSSRDVFKIIKNKGRQL